MRLLAVFVVGVGVGIFSPSASAQPWDVPEALKAIAVSIQALSDRMVPDAVTGRPAPKNGPLMHGIAPDGTAVPLRVTADGRVLLQ